MLAIRTLLHSSIGLTAREREAAAILKFDPEAQLAPKAMATRIDTLLPVPGATFSLPTWVKLARAAVEPKADVDDAERLHSFLASRVVERWHGDAR